ncbi:hypothetical protein SmJEL517_g03596 [Synchytrium microbalum]|uniref:RING-type E3 ubiquitin transferase n=1 Tax=Synchytrium microbalum TaxID=1806994 RepID=A0A507C6C1_9FUNG|nr:uncharacterized protein SmJEL517_g03596 [Synchytrium microbalum]TPX33516.1 hypothetical protein SmJEL517_g03596 [Synchytrium microbalum]
MVSRLALYGLLSTSLASTVTLHAIFERNAQFYATCIHLTSSPICLLILLNMGLFSTIIFGRGAQRAFFGDLRPLEVEHLYEKSWFAVTETCLAMTIFRDDFDVKFLSMFVILLSVKIFHWLSQDRVDFMEQTPNLSWLFHIRIVSINLIMLLVDSCMLAYSVSYTLWKGPSMMIIFGFEYTILLSLVISTTAKYVLHTIDLRNENPWEDKSMYIFYVDLVIDFIKLATYCLFFGIVVHFYGLPLHIIRDLYMTLRSFVQRVKDLIQYRRATRNMDSRYPDATAADLAGADRTCIICREEMNVQNNPPIAQRGPARASHPDTPKKLPCGHTFHFRCLRSWLERQQSCPTCRRSVLTENVAPPRPAAAPAPAAAPPQQPPAHQQHQPPQLSGQAPQPDAQLFHPWNPSAWSGPSGSSTGHPSLSRGASVSDFTTSIHTSSGVFPVTLTPLLPMGYGLQGQTQSSPPLPVLDHLTDTQLTQLEGTHREAILSRIRAIQDVQRQLNGVVTQLTQLTELMHVPNSFSSGVASTQPAAATSSSSSSSAAQNKDKDPVRP